MALAFVVGLSAQQTAWSFGQSWQDIVQPVGVLQVNPPQSAGEVNRYLMSLDPNITPATAPFDARTDVTRIVTTQNLYFTRIFDPPTGSNAVGSWLVRPAELRGMSAQQIRNVLALPAMPKFSAFVIVPAGITMLTGIAGPIAGWGEGGANQSKLIGPPFVPIGNYFNLQALGDCFLCYRVLAPDGNANRVGAALDRAIAPAYSSLETLYNNLDMMYYGPAAQRFRDALLSLSGEGATGSQTVAFANSATFIDGIRQQATNWVGRSASGVGLWGNLSGASSSLRGDNGSATLNATGATVQVGLGHAIDPDVVVGAAIGGSNSGYSVADRFTTGTYNAVSLALYGVARKENFYAAGTLSYSHGDTGMTRQVTVNELFNKQQGNFSTDVVGARIELGLRGAAGNLSVTPFAAFQPTWLRQGAFSEGLTGASNSLVNMGLNYQSQSVTSLPASLGLQVDGQIPLEGGWTLSPSLRAAWIYEFQTDRSLQAALAMLPGQSFTVYGASAARNTAQVQLGLTAFDGDRVTGYLTLGADLSDRGQALQARAGLNIAF